MIVGHFNFSAAIKKHSCSFKKQFLYIDLGGIISCNTFSVVPSAINYIPKKSC